MGSGAAVPLVRAHAETDLDCAGAAIRIEEEWGGHYKAVGCGRKANYQTSCIGLTCEVRSDDEGAIPDQARPDPSDPIQPR
jgi:hypothetical protein